MAISVQSVTVVEQVATVYTKPGQTAATIKDVVQSTNSSDPSTQTQNLINAGISSAQLATAIATTIGKSLPGGGLVAPISLVNNTQQIANQLASGQPVSAALVNQALSDVAAIAGSAALLAAAALGSPVALGIGAALILASGALTVIALVDGDSEISPELQSLLEDIHGAVQDLMQQLGDLADQLGDIMDNIGDQLADGFIDFGLGLGDLINDVLDEVNDWFNAAKDWIQRRDPLTLDLDGDGLESTGIDPNNPILFDHDGDGVKNATGWVKPDDGFLVLDRDGNGTIDNGTELFGDSTPLSNGGTAADGFAALADQDTNHDGVVNANDANWADLRVWRDLNQNGISEAGELTTLEENGIAGLVVTKTENAQALANGNQIADLGHFIRADGSEGTLGQVTGGMADIDLADNPFYREFPDPIPLTEQAQTLPDLQGSGSVRDLQEASSLSTGLSNTVAGFAAADTQAEQLALVDDLITEWAQTSGNQTSIELAEEQGYQLVYLIPGLTAQDFAPITFVNIEPEGVNDGLWERAA